MVFRGEFVSGGDCYLQSCCDGVVRLRFSWFLFWNLETRLGVSIWVPMMIIRGELDFTGNSPWLRSRSLYEWSNQWRRKSDPLCIALALIQTSSDWPLSDRFNHELHILKIWINRNLSWTNTRSQGRYVLYCCSLELYVFILIYILCADSTHVLIWFD